MWRLIEQGHIELLLPEIAIVVGHADAQPPARLQEAYARIEKTPGIRHVLENLECAHHIVALGFPRREIDHVLRCHRPPS